MNRVNELFICKVLGDKKYYLYKYNSNSGKFICRYRIKKYLKESFNIYSSNSTNKIIFYNLDENYIALQYDFI